MILRRRPTASALLLLLAGSALEAQAAHRTAGAATWKGAAGRVRTYFVAADEVDWTYVPSGGDQALTGKRNWLFHRHMPGHFSGGMYARFNVLLAAGR
jgi:hypothetical protein